MSVDPKELKIDPSRDAYLNDFTSQTLRERYMLPGEQSPQEAFARAAAAFADDLPHAQRLYDYVSKEKPWFMFATPILSNGGSERGLPISCFLAVAEDSRQGIFNHWEETGWLASVGGGVGGYWGDVRSTAEKTSRGSSSTGVIPFISVVDRLILSVSQGGTRRGSYAAYLNIDHPEIEEFITMRKPTGGDQNRKTTNLHNAVNVSDEFMLAVQADMSFDLRSPKDGTVMKTVRARDLWRLLIETRMQTGEPYMVFIDTINRALPEAQKKLGLSVKQSNLCVAPYTNLLTKDGNFPIGALKDRTVEVWNGEEWSEVTVRQTSESAELIRVCFEDGDYLDCTPEHNFHLEDGSVVPAAALANGARLAPANHPRIEHDAEGDVARAYTAGWATFAGMEDEGHLTIVAPATLSSREKIKLLTHSVNSSLDDSGVTTIRYEHDTIPSGFVPFTWSFEERLNWLRGAFDATGEGNGSHVSIGSTDADLIREIRLMCLECGMSPRVRLTPTMNVLTLGISAFFVLPMPIRAQVVADVHPLPFRMETYCATEPKRNRLVFNGYLTGNCTEITLPTGRDFNDKMRTAVCCLSSANAETFDEWKDDPLFLPDLFRMLDNALSVFISDAPSSLHNAVYSAMRERSVGLGVLGFQAYLQSKMIPMGSEEARKLNLTIFQHIRGEADRASRMLGRERGEAPDMAGTGERFAHKLAVAPNASSSIICGGTSPSIEPHRANAYLHKTLSGSFPVRNPYLVKALQELGLDNDATWQSIIANEGSVQHLDLPQHVKDVFKTAPEIDQLVLVRLAADRAPLICQAQSLNLFFEHDANAQAITEAHYRAWAWGVKSLYYLRSTTPKRAENTNQKVERVKMVEGALPLLTDPADCLACEG